jgi:hypothetical protein
LKSWSEVAEGGLATTPATTSQEAIMLRKVSPYQAPCLLVLVGSLLGPACYALEKYPYTHASPPQTSRYLRDHSIDVDDASGHKVRIAEIQRTYTQDHPVIMGTKVVETWFRGFTDYIGGTGPGYGYETWILEDGNKIFVESKFHSTSEATPTGSRRGTSYATTRFVGGTGKFSSIQGTLTSTVEFDSDPRTGYNRPTSKGEYWFAK